MWFFLLDTRAWPERSYERGSILASAHPLSSLSVSFLRIVSFVFSKTWYGIRGPYSVTCDSRIFLEKLVSKMVKKQGFFGLFKKINSLALSGIDVK